MKTLDSTSLTDEQQDLLVHKTTHSSFHIQFDYRYDTSRWFDNKKKACLEYAASLWEKVINEDFPDIAAGTTVKVLNPNTGNYNNVTLSSNVDDIVIFVGAFDLTPSSWYTQYAMAAGGFNTDYSINGRDNTSSSFQPGVGTLVVSKNPQYSNGSNAKWFIDSTPETSNDIPNRNTEYIDFIAAMTHEIGHILGIGTGSKAYKKVISNLKFNGSHTVEINGGGVPVTGLTGHISENYKYDGQSPLLSTNGAFARRNPSVIDYAVLSDIGYNIDFNEEINLYDTGLSNVHNVQAGIGDDTLRGNSLSNTLYGMDGSDLLWGGSGSASDVLIDYSGSNMFYWSDNDGIDYIVSTGKGSVLNCYGISFDQHTGGFSSDGNDLWVGKTGETNEAVISNWNSTDPSNRVQSFLFDGENGTTKAFAWNNGKDIEVRLDAKAYRCSDTHYLECVDTSNALLGGSDGNDTIIGGSGNDQIWGGSGGNDLLYGGSGSDTYWFSSSDGQDTIGDFSYSNDKIMLWGSGFTTSDVSITKQNNDLIFTIGSATLDIQNGYGLIGIANTVQINNGGTYTVNYNNGVYSLV